MAHVDKAFLFEISKVAVQHIRGSSKDSLRLIELLFHDRVGRVLEIFSVEPVQDHVTNRFLIHRPHPRSVMSGISNPNTLGSSSMGKPNLWGTRRKHRRNADPSRMIRMQVVGTRVHSGVGYIMADAVRAAGGCASLVHLSSTFSRSLQERT